MHAPPGRDRFVMPRDAGRGRYKPFFDAVRAAINIYKDNTRDPAELKL